MGDAARRKALDLALGQGIALRRLAERGRVLVVIAPGASRPDGVALEAGREGALVGASTPEATASWAPPDVSRVVATEPGGAWFWCIVRTSEGTAAVPLTWATGARGAA